MSSLKMRLWIRKTAKYFELTCNWCNCSGSRQTKGAMDISDWHMKPEVKQLAISYDQGKLLLSLL
jgi:hypothetical protein